jgi:hypothetical protein
VHGRHVVKDDARNPLERYAHVIDSPDRQIEINGGRGQEQWAAQHEVGMNDGRERIHVSLLGSPLANGEQHWSF